LKSKLNKLHSQLNKKGGTSVGPTTVAAALKQSNGTIHGYQVKSSARNGSESRGCTLGTATSGSTFSNSEHKRSKSQNSKMHSLCSVIVSAEEGGD
jgi:hypothetical protein